MTDIKKKIKKEAVEGKSDWLENARDRRANRYVISEYFKQLRFDETHHIGLGDIRLTIAQQNEICDLVERL